MSNTRKRKLIQAEKRKKGREEELNARNEYGIRDPTPQMAIHNIIDREQKTSV